MAGGITFNDVQAGGNLYSYEQDQSSTMCVGNKFKISNTTKILSYPDVMLASGIGFENSFNLLVLKE